MNDERKSGNTVLLTVIGVATLLVALVGATFAYFSATVSNDAQQSVYITTAAPVGLVYTGEQFESLNIEPGYTKTSTFTVANTGSATGGQVKINQTYDLNFIIDTNTFTAAAGEAGNTEVEANGTETGKKRQEQLFVTITAASDKTNNPAVAFGSANGGKVNVTDGATAAKTGTIINIVNDQLIAADETHTYTLKLDFENLSISQNQNTGKSFSAHVEISDPRSV